MQNAQTYQNLVPSQNQSAPKFMAMIAASTQPFVDQQNLLGGLNGAFDIDAAVGSQLDVIGLWVGFSRVLKVPLGTTYFSFDTLGFGWDQAPWKRPSDPNTSIVILPDQYYRVALKAQVLNNRWDGTIQGAYNIMLATWAPIGYTILINDHADLTMGLILVGPITPDNTLLQMFATGLLDIKPAGIAINSRIYQPGSTIGRLDVNFVLDQSKLL